MRETLILSNFFFEFCMQTIFLSKNGENGDKYIEILEDPTKTKYEGLHHNPRVTKSFVFDTRICIYE